MRAFEYTSTRLTIRPCTMRRRELLLPKYARSLSMARSGQIEIGLSYHVIFELLQRANSAHRASRLSRARVLSEICGLNVFPYPTDLGSGHRFSKEGFWQPRITLDDHEIEVIVSHFIQAVQRDPDATPHARRIVTKRKYLHRFSEDYPERVIALAGRRWPVMFGRSMVEDGTFGRYLAATISREEANRKLWFFINDPASIYQLWFEQCNWDCPIMERRDNIAAKLVTMLRVAAGHDGARKGSANQDHCRIERDGRSRTFAGRTFATTPFAKRRWGISRGNVFSATTLRRRSDLETSIRGRERTPRMSA